MAAGVALGIGLMTALAGCGSSHKAATPTPTSLAGSSTTTPPPNGPTTTTTTTSPAALLAEAMTDAKARQTMHIIITAHAGTTTARYTDDAAVGRGQQTITAGGVEAKVIWVNNIAYIMGNAQAVTGFFGFPAAEGPKLAGHWVAIPPANANYPTVIDAVGIGSALQELGVKGPFTLTPPTTKDGQKVIGIKGTASSPDAGNGTSATLYITDHPTPLPVEYDSNSSQGTESTVFSAWGAPVSLMAPSPAIPVDSLPSPTGSPSPASPA